MKNMVKTLSLALLCASGQGIFAASAESQPPRSLDIKKTPLSNIGQIKDFVRSDAYNNLPDNHLVINHGTKKFRRYVKPAQARRFQMRLASLNLNTRAAGQHRLVDGAIEFEHSDSPRREAFIKDCKDTFAHLSSAYNSAAYRQNSRSREQQPEISTLAMTDASAIARTLDAISKHESACDYKPFNGHTTTDPIYIANGKAHVLAPSEGLQQQMRIDALDLISAEAFNPNEPLSPGLSEYIEAGKQQFDALEKASNYTKGQARAKEQRSTLLGAMWYGATNLLVGSKGNLEQVTNLNFDNRLGSLEAVRYAASTEKKEQKEEEESKKDKE